jgi:hypothetical protein
VSSAVGAHAVDDVVPSRQRIMKGSISSGGSRVDVHRRGSPWRGRCGEGGFPAEISDSDDAQPYSVALSRQVASYCRATVVHEHDLK